jgi:hypothetical protein
MPRNRAPPADVCRLAMLCAVSVIEWEGQTFAAPRTAALTLRSVVMV